MYIRLLFFSLLLTALSVPAQTPEEIQEPYIDEQLEADLAEMEAEDSLYQTDSTYTHQSVKYGHESGGLQRKMPLWMTALLMVFFLLLAAAAMRLLNFFRRKQARQTALAMRLQQINTELSKQGLSRTEKQRLLEEFNRVAEQLKAR